MHFTFAHAFVGAGTEQRPVARGRGSPQLREPLAAHRLAAGVREHQTSVGAVNLSTDGSEVAPPPPGFGEAGVRALGFLPLWGPSADRPPGFSTRRPSRQPTCFDCRTDRPRCASPALGSANPPVPRTQDRPLRWLALVRRPFLLASPMGTSRSGRRALQRLETCASQGDGPEWGWETCVTTSRLHSRGHRHDLSVSCCPERPTRKPPRRAQARTKRAARPRAA